MDPQTIVEGVYRKTDTAELITFNLRMLMVEWTVIVTLPYEGRYRSPVYIKTQDNQEMKVDGIFRDTGRSDIIIVTIPMTPMKFEIVCIVTIPYGEDTTAPVYLKHRLVK